VSNDLFSRDLGQHADRDWKERIMIVVGVDGSEESQQALRWALAEAKLRGSSVRAVHAWRYRGYGYIPPDVMDANALLSAAANVLRTAVDEVAGDTAGVELEQVVLQGPAAKELIDESERAEMLVVGSRGHGGFAGLMLGSVSQHCAQHAHCPVVIVRPSIAAD
jgi:nucleotide-binding universal stress UspA family protein